MSLSPLVSFKSRFVTYLLNFPRIIWISQWCYWRPGLSVSLHK